MTRVSNGVTAYRICARAEGKHQLANPWDISGYTKQINKAGDW
jgi:hypothetical protein